MPVPDRRDPETTRTILQSWLARQPPAADQLVIDAVQTPAGNGFSAETLMFDAAWQEAGNDHRERLDAKVAPTEFQIFPEPIRRTQFGLLQILASTQIPVPAVHWQETSSDVLGAPFYVMSRVDGDVPTDMPPYHSGGWLTEVSPAEREKHLVVERHRADPVHALDVSELGLDFVDQSGYGPTGLRQRLAYYEHYLDWAYEGAVPTAQSALKWLREHRPAETREPLPLWGDSRIGNIIFADVRRQRCWTGRWQRSVSPRMT